jgi:hypothetical protein
MECSAEAGFEVADHGVNPAEIREILEVGAFYWTVPAPDIVNLGREEQGSISV